MKSTRHRRSNNPNKMFHFRPSTQLTSSDDERHRLVSNGWKYFDAFVFPATGPRGLCTMGFDHRVVKEWHPDKRRWLFGGSTGALRLLAILTSLLTGEDNVQRLEDDYINLTYRYGDTSQRLEKLTNNIYTTVAPPHLLDSLLQSEWFNIGILVTEIQPPFHLLPDALFMFCLVFFGVLSCIHPWFTRLFFRQILFTNRPCDVVDVTPDLTIRPLTKDNFYDVLHASCGIPTVQTRVTRIGNEWSGWFCDAALSHYALNLRLRTHTLLLHDLESTERVCAHFYDRYIPYRHLTPVYFEYCSILSLSPHFTHHLLEKRLPGVQDWFRRKYIDIPERRKMHWNKARWLSNTMFARYSFQ